MVRLEAVFRALVDAPDRGISHSRYWYINYFSYFDIVVTISNLDCKYIMMQTIVEVHTSSNLACMYTMLQTIVEHIHPLNPL
jgi:hypothetical protein